MPGAGAEVFSQRIREALFPRKIGWKRWLEIHGEAHELGITTNATLLFGHMETLEKRVTHLFRLRDQRTEPGASKPLSPFPFSRKTRLWPILQAPRAWIF